MEIISVSIAITNKKFYNGGIKNAFYSGTRYRLVQTQELEMETLFIHEGF